MRTHPNRCNRQGFFYQFVSGWSARDLLMRKTAGRQSREDAKEALEVLTYWVRPPPARLADLAHLLRPCSRQHGEGEVASSVGSLEWAALAFRAEM